MRNPPAAFKHADPTHLEFGKSADSSLLAKQRRGYDDGGEVEDPAGQASPVPPGMRPGGVAKMAKAYPGWPTMSIDSAWENHPAKKSSYERTNPSWG